MTSADKFDILPDLDRRKKKAKITTVRGKTYYCKPLHFAEDEDDWAYDFFHPTIRRNILFSIGKEDVAVIFYSIV